MNEYLMIVGTLMVPAVTHAQSIVPLEGFYVGAGSNLSTTLNNGSYGVTALLARSLVERLAMVDVAQHPGLRDALLLGDAGNAAMATRF